MILGLDDQGHSFPKECRKSSDQLVSDDALVRSITTSDDQSIRLINLLF